MPGRVRVLARSRRTAEAVAAALAAADLAASAATFGDGPGPIAGESPESVPDLLVLVEPAAADSALATRALPATTALLLLVDGDPPPPSDLSRPFGWLPLDSGDGQLQAAAVALLNGLDVQPSGLGAARAMARDDGDALRLPAIRDPIDPAELREPLTARELEVFELLAKGLANREIAAALGITRHTAKFHVGQILEKTGAATRTEAVRQGFRLGLIGL